MAERAAMAPSQKDVQQMTERAARNQGYSDGFAGREPRSTDRAYRESYKRGQQARGGE